MYAVSLKLNSIMENSYKIQFPPSEKNNKRPNNPHVIYSAVNSSGSTMW